MHVLRTVEVHRLAGPVRHQPALHLGHVETDVAAQVHVHVAQQYADAILAGIRRPGRTHGQRHRRRRDLPVPALAQQGQFALLPVDGAFGLGRAGRQQATAKQYAPRTPAHSRAYSGAGAFTGDTAICTMPSSRRRITPFCSCRR